eukprot:403351523
MENGIYFILAADNTKSSDYKREGYKKDSSAIYSRFSTQFTQQSIMQSYDQQSSQQVKTSFHYNDCQKVISNSTTFNYHQTNFKEDFSKNQIYSESDLQTLIKNKKNSKIIGNLSRTSPKFQPQKLILEQGTQSAMSKFELNRKVVSFRKNLNSVQVVSRFSENSDYYMEYLILSKIMKLRAKIFQNKKIISNQNNQLKAYKEIVEQILDEDTSNMIKIDKKDQELKRKAKVEYLALNGEKNSQFQCNSMLFCKVYKSLYILQWCVATRILTAIEDFIGGQTNMELFALKWWQEASSSQLQSQGRAEE